MIRCSGAPAHGRVRRFAQSVPGANRGFDTHRQKGGVINRGGPIRELL